MTPANYPLTRAAHLCSHQRITLTCQQSFGTFVAKFTGECQLARDGTNVCDIRERTMKYSFAALGLVALPALVLGQTLTMSIPSQLALVDQYCAGCHNDKLKSGGFSFSTIDLAHSDRDAPQLERVILKLRTGMMPPAGMPRPSAGVLQSFAASIENAIDKSAALHQNPGRPSLHRLNRTEYRNSIRDLLRLEIDVESILPADDMSHGF